MLLLARSDTTAAFARSSIRVPAMPACDVSDCMATSAYTLVAYSIIFGAGRYVFSPMFFPKTYTRLGTIPGQRGYWDSSWASLMNAYMAVLAIFAVMRLPEFATSPDAFLKSTDSCRLVVIFPTWNCFDLVHMLYHWQFGAQWAMLVHHVSAVTAWALYLEGGYGHALSLVGLGCEATNPFMNIRYFLQETGHRESKWYVYNGIAFCVAWLVVRIGFAIPAGVYLITIQWASLQALPAWRRYFFAGFFGVGASLNLMWGQRLFLGALKVLRGGGGGEASTKKRT